LQKKCQLLLGFYDAELSYKKKCCSARIIYHLHALAIIHRFIKTYKIKVRKLEDRVKLSSLKLAAFLQAIADAIALRFLKTFA
jgi:serine/threonine protein kinase